jgi:putative MFS transporter
MSALSFMEKPPTRPGFLPRLIVAACGGPFLDGYVMSVIGVALIGVTAELSPTANESGLIGAASLIGIFVGAGCFGFVTDRIGRRKMFVLDVSAIVVACVACLFVSDAWQLIALRFIVGVAVGADHPVATSLLAEFTPTKKRGFMVGASAAAFSVGAAFAYLVGAAVVAVTGSNAHWRFMLGTCALLGLVVLALRWGCRSRRVGCCGAVAPMRSGRSRARSMA